jgi:hypothetical protein
MLLFYYIQLYHHHEVGLGVVDALFLAADKPFFQYSDEVPFVSGFSRLILGFKASA